METTGTTTAPRVYVACLACYNAGRLAGKWHDATADLADNVAEWIEEHNTADRDGYGDHEEFAIHDHEGFGSSGPDEFDNLDAVGMIGAAIIEHGAPFVAFCASESFDSAESAVEAFAESFAGEWDSLTEYAENLADDCYGVDRLAGEGVRIGTGIGDGYRDAARFLAGYFDAERFARDLVAGGDVWTEPAPGGGVFVFRSY